MKYKNFRNVKVLANGTITATVDEVRLFSTKPVEVYLECFHLVAKVYSESWRMKDTGRFVYGRDVENMYNVYKAYHD